jgi:hypothetical protein
MITTLSRVLRVRLRTLLVVIAFLGLVFAVIVQTVRLRQTEVRLLAELRLQRTLAEESFQKARIATDQLLTKIAEEMNDGGKVRSDMSRLALKRTLTFYEGMELNGATAEARAMARERVRQIRLQLDEEHGEEKL